MRLAWFTPLPPLRSGISAYSAELLPWLSSSHAIDVVVAPGGTFPPPDPAVRVVDLWEFQRRHLRHPYDAIVYQVGNAPCHDYMWPALFRYPGLLVLHDGQLHHARARALLRRGRRDHYRAEFAANHPDAPPALTEFVVNGLQGSPYFLWPMRRLIIEQARVTAVHSAPLAATLRSEHPEATIVHIPMGVRAPTPCDDRREPHAGVVFGAFGLITAEKRIPQVLRTFAAVRSTMPGSRLVLIGAQDDHYDPVRDIEALGLRDHVTVTGYVDDAEVDAWLSRIDVAVCLRWPTAGESSASWLRCLAAGRPTVTTDLVHSSDVPSLDPRTWLVQHTRADAHAARVPPTWRDAVTVAVDVLDEEHSLGLAMSRLANDRELRETLGANALEHWRAHHTLAHMRDAYESALNAMATRPLRQRPARPAHLDDDATGIITATADAFGIAAPF